MPVPSFQPGKDESEGQVAPLPEDDEGEEDFDEVEAVEPSGAGDGERPPVIEEIEDEPLPDPEQVKEAQDVQFRIKVEQMYRNVPEGDHNPSYQKELRSWGFI